MPRPKKSEYPEYFERYIALVQGDSIAEIISNYNDKQVDFIDSLPDNKATFAYADGKWTMKEVVRHISDTERVFAYRVLAVSRGETQTLTGFGQDIYAENSNTARASFDDIKEEFKAVRYATNILLRSLSETQLDRIGNVADYQASARSFAYNIYGHFIHHQRIFEEHYL